MLRLEDMVLNVLRNKHKYVKSAKISESDGIVEKVSAETQAKIM